MNTPSSKDETNTEVLSMLRGLNHERLGSTEVPGPSPANTFQSTTVTKISSGMI